MKPPKANNTYTGYYKINDEYYCLDENGTPRTGDVTLTVNGGSCTVLNFQPAETDRKFQERCTVMDGRVLQEQPVSSGNIMIPVSWTSSKIGQLMVHGVIVTELDGRKDAENSYLIDKNGYLLKKTMKKATDGKYYLDR